MAWVVRILQLLRFADEETLGRQIIYFILGQSAQSAMEYISVWEVWDIISMPKIHSCVYFNWYLRNSKSGELFRLNTALSLSTSNWTIFSLSSYELSRKSACINRATAPHPKKKIYLLLPQGSEVFVSEFKQKILKLLDIFQFI